MKNGRPAARAILAEGRATKYHEVRTIQREVYFVARHTCIQMRIGNMYVIL